MAKKRKLYANASYQDMVCVLESNKHLDITQYAKKLRMQKHQKLCDVVVRGKRFGDLPISQVDHHHVQVALQSVWHLKKRTAFASYVTEVLRFADAFDLRENMRSASETVAMAKLRLKDYKLPPTKHYAALHYSEMPEFYQKLANSDLSDTFKFAAQFAILTAARQVEVLRMQWHHLDFKNRLWEIPCDIHKNGEAQQKTLSSYAIDVLTQFENSKNVFHRLLFRTNYSPRVVTERRGLVFKPYFKPKKNKYQITYLNGRNGLNKIPKQLGYKNTMHGICRSPSVSWMREQLKVDKAVCDVILGHKVYNATDAAYFVTPFKEERFDALEKWGKYLNQDRATLSLVA